MAIGHYRRDSGGTGKTGAGKLLQQKLAASQIEPKLSNFLVISSLGENLLGDSENSAQNIVSKEVFGKVLAALQLKEQKNQLYYGSLNLLNYSVELFIPLTTTGASDLVLYTEVPMASIRAELHSLLVLGISMILLLTVIQTLFGYLLYRILIIPLRSLLKGAEQIASGDFKTGINAGKRSDELGHLIFLFNEMASSLDEKTTNLDGAMKELQHFSNIMNRELHMAQQIQESLLPGNGVSDMIKMACYYAPLEKVSGDFYDVFPLPGGSVGILQIDVSGHGVPAALITIMAKLRFSSHAPEFMHPGDLLQKVNVAMCRDISTGEYVTAFYLVLHPDRTIEFCNAGHQRVIQVHKKTGELEELDSPALFLGIKDDMVFKDNTGKVETGDRLIFFTDGIVERMNHEDECYGHERFMEQIKKYNHLSIEAFNENIRLDVEAFAAGRLQNDDVTLMTIEVQPESIKPLRQERRRTMPTLIDAIETFRRRDFQRAAIMFRQLLESEPLNQVAKFYLASILLYGKAFPAAAIMFEDLAIGQHANPYVHLNLGICYFRLSFTDKAISEYEKALLHNDKILEVYYYLACAYMQNENWLETETNIDLALTLAPDNQKLLQIKNQVRILAHPKRAAQA